jgi:PAS domain S-box-containing protein
VHQSSRGALLATYPFEPLRQSPALTRITDFAAALCGTHIALVTLLDDERQLFLSRTGTDVEGTARNVAFCEITIQSDSPVISPDTSTDPRFAENPLVTGEPHIRFYAGAPLLTEEGQALGSLCVLDTEPRPEGLTPLQLQGLECLADAVMARLRDVREDAAWRAAEDSARRAAADNETRFHTLADTMPQMVWSTLPDGYHDYYNARWYDFTGVPAGSTDGEAWNGMFHPDDQERAWAAWRHSLTTGEPYQIEYRLRHRDGAYRWVLGRALPIRDADGRIVRWFGTCTDIHEQKLAAEEREVIAQELSHRIKNIFAVISGLISFAARSRPELAEAAADLRQRIAALGRAHDFVRPHSRQSQPMLRQDSLRGLLDALFAPYQRADGGLTIRGEDVSVDDRAATPLALLFHELATNAAKYGALSAETGQVTVEVTRRGDTVVLDWTETGGPPVRPADKEGFGTQLIELSAMRQLGGTVTRDWRPEGLAMRIEVPVLALSRV